MNQLGAYRKATEDDCLVPLLTLIRNRNAETVDLSDAESVRLRIETLSAVWQSQELSK
jgi:hypothetical protein